MERWWVSSKERYGSPNSSWWDHSWESIYKDFSHKNAGWIRAGTFQKQAFVPLALYCRGRLIEAVNSTLNAELKPMGGSKSDQAKSVWGGMPNSGQLGRYKTRGVATFAFSVGKWDVDKMGEVACWGELFISKNLYKCVSDKFLEAKIWQPSNCHGQGLLKDPGPRPILTSVLKQRSRTRYPRKPTVSKETSSHLSLRFS